MKEKGTNFRRGVGVGVMGQNLKKVLASIHGTKSPDELATDYEIFPKSLLYRLCDTIGEKTGTVLLNPHIATVGNCADDVYYGFLKARREGKKLVILWPYELPGRLRFGLTNSEVINIGSEYRAFPHNSAITVISRYVITGYFAFFRTLSILRRIILGRHLNNVFRIPAMGEAALWCPAGVTEFSWEVVGQYKWPEQWASPLDLSLEENKRLQAETQRKILGLPSDAWFVCLHVRESGFRDSETYTEKDAYTERNANIINYIDAIREITSRGGWVVRMGDASMTKLPSMDRVIDYPFTDSKSALMDVYLISQCRVYIGMISGIYNLAELFQRPIITMNLNNWMVGYPPKKGDLAIFKRIFSKSRNRCLSIKEWIAEPWNAVSWCHKLGDDYLFLENTPDELKAVVREFFDRAENSTRSSLQMQFDDARIRRGIEIIGKQMFFADDVAPYYRKKVVDYDLVERYRLASRLDSAVGMIGSEFLEQNWDFNQGGAGVA